MARPPSGRSHFHVTGVAGPAILTSVTADPTYFGELTHASLLPLGVAFSGKLAFPNGVTTWQVGVGSVVRATFQKICLKMA